MNPGCHWTGCLWWSTTSSTDLSLLRLVLVILGKEMWEDVATAAGNVDKWTFLAKTETGWYRQHHSNRLDNQRPLAEVTTDDETAQYCLYLHTHRQSDWRWFTQQTTTIWWESNQWIKLPVQRKYTTTKELWHDRKKLITDEKITKTHSEIN